MATAVTEFPKKRDHRQRAHCNPLSDSQISYPLSPNHVDWSLHYPKYFQRKNGADGGDCSEASHQQLYINTTEHPIVYSDDPVAPELHSRGGGGGSSGSGGPAGGGGSTSSGGGVIDIIDLGCGFGGMTIRLAELFPEKLVLGLEIREKVSNFVGKKIEALRCSVAAPRPAACSDPKADLNETGRSSQITAAVSRSADAAAAALASGCDYQNCAVLRTNAMKFLPNYIRKASVEKIFILFPDPHFKKSNWRRRIITPQLLSTYAYHLKPELGRLYFSTDVFDLFQWMKLSCDKHPLFEPIEHTDDDQAFAAMFDTTDECKKAIRLNQKLYGAVYKRVC